MAGRPLAGSATLTVDGVVYNIVGEGDYRVSVPKKETAKGQTAVEGYIETPMEGYIGATLRLQPDQSSSILLNASASTVVLQRNSGQTIYGSGMWQTEEGSTKTADGTMTVKFEGALVTEEVAA